MDARVKPGHDNQKDDTATHASHMQQARRIRDKKVTVVRSLRYNAAGDYAIRRRNFAA